VEKAQSPKTYTMKENNGHAARRLLWNRVAWSLIGLGCFLLSGTILVIVRSDSRGSDSPNRLITNQEAQRQAQLRRKASRAANRRNAAAANEQQQQQHLDGAIAPAALLGISQAELDDILSARVHLIDLSIDAHELQRRASMDNNAVDNTHADDKKTKKHYAGVYGTFCRIDWSLHKTNPSTYPMFRDLIANSDGCSEESEQRIEDVDIFQLARLSRAYDAPSPLASTFKTKVLNFTGAVFHESRCGSTLVANLLSAVEPAQHRVYSESSPPLKALYQVCGADYARCTMATAAAVLQDVIYLMSRTDNLQEERVFFKIQSAGSRNLPVFTKAFPDTPYLFVYREPVQVMMSHLKQGIRHANCVRDRSSPPVSVQDVVLKYTPHLHAARLEPEHYCAAHLASITETIVSHLTIATGQTVNYADLVPTLYQSVLPRWLHVPQLSPAQLQRLTAVASVYSKNRGGNRVQGEFQSDSAQKEQTASAAVRSAANLYLYPSYVKLERLSEHNQPSPHATG
jgi:hypothetical protein